MKSRKWYVRLPGQDIQTLVFDVPVNESHARAQARATLFYGVYYTPERLPSGTKVWPEVGDAGQVKDSPPAHPVIR